MEVWKMAVIGKANFIVDLYVTKVREEGEFEIMESMSSPGGAFDSPVYQIAKYDNDKDFYESISRLWKKSQDNIKLSRDAKVNVNPYVIKGKNLYPEFFVWY